MKKRMKSKTPLQNIINPDQSPYNIKYIHSDLEATQLNFNDLKSISIRTLWHRVTQFVNIDFTPTQYSKCTGYIYHIALK